MSKNLERTINPYQSPTSIEKLPKNNFLKRLPKTIKGTLIPGYAFYLQYQIEKQDEPLSDNTWQKNFINELPTCTLIELSKLYIFGITTYTLTQFFY